MTNRATAANLPMVAPRSEDWAYLRAYHALADASMEPFAEVTIRAEDLTILLKRLVAAETKTP